MPHWVFVWTISDMVGAVIVGGIALFFGVLFAMLGVDKLWHKITGKHLSYNRPKR